MTQAAPNPHAREKAAWLSALNTIGTAERDGPIWRGTGSIIERMARFVEPAGVQVLHLDGVRNRWNGLQRTAERGVLMATLDGRPTHVFKPAFLALEHFPDCSQDSYLVLGLENLAPTGRVEPGALREDLAPVRDRVAAPGVEMGVLNDASRCLGGHLLLSCAGSTWAQLEAPEVAVVIDYVRRRMARQSVRVAA